MADLIEVAPKRAIILPDGTLNCDEAVGVQQWPAAPLVLRMRAGARMTDDQFFRFCQQNRDLRIEQTAAGDVLIMPPAGPESSDRNGELTTQLRLWAKREGSGVAFDSSAGFTLPDSAVLSPDASWILKERLAALTSEQRRGFWPICPDFVAELRSSTDRLSALQAKLQQFIDNGARLGWLIDPEPRHLHVYRPGQPVERLENPTTVPGDPVLPGFVLDAQAVFDTSF
jgi:Uma2 family endonuclease